MRGMFRFRSNSALAMVVAAGLAVSGFSLGAIPAEAKSKGGGGTNSKEFVAAAMPLQKKVDEIEKLKADPAQLAAGATQAMPMAEAAAAAAKTPQDMLLAGQFFVTLGGYNGDMAARQRGAQMMIDSGRLDPAQLPQFNFYLGNFAYASKDYMTAVKAFKAASDLGFQHDQMLPLMLQAYGSANMAKDGLLAAQQMIATRKAAGLAVPEDWISRANVVAYKANLGPEAIMFSTMLVQEHPSNFNWLASTQMVRSFAGLDPQATLDLFRLMDRSGALDNDAQYVQGEYKEYIETADPRKNPGEVASLISRAVAKGKLKSADGWVSDANTNATSRIAADKASLPALVKEASGAADGKTALLAADVSLNYDMFDQAVEMYKLALTKGGVDANIAQTRLGIAQYSLGNNAEAGDAFAKVTGPRATVAKLWQALIASKAAPAAPVG
jgi:tetratricopeptide (TPR) repeat protein